MGECSVEKPSHAGVLAGSFFPFSSPMQAEGLAALHSEGERGRMLLKGPASCFCDRRKEKERCLPVCVCTPFSPFAACCLCAPSKHTSLAHGGRAARPLTGLGAMCVKILLPIRVGGSCCAFLSACACAVSSVPPCKSRHRQPALQHCRVRGCVPACCRRQGQRERKRMARNGDKSRKSDAALACLFPPCAVSSHPSPRALSGGDSTA